MFCWKFRFFILFILNQLGSFKDLKITFWLDSVQNEIYEDVPFVFKVLESLNLEVNIRDTYLIVQDEIEEEVRMQQFCQIATDEGISLILDFTYQPWRQGLAFVNEQGIPYLKVNRMLRPFMQMLGAYLNEKGANNIALIFQNEQDTREALMQMIEGFPFRAILLNAEKDRNFVERLRYLRPSPAYYGIFARGTNMNSIFEKIYNASVFARPTEWHFIFLDARDRVFKFKKQAEFANKFALNGKSICRAMGMKDTFCASGFTLQRAVLLQILRNVVEVSQLKEDSFQSKIFECNDTEAYSGAPVKLDWLDEFKMLEFISINTDEEVDNGMPSVSFTINSTISFYSNEHEAKTDLAIWSNDELRKINETITPAKRFFRIGVAEALPWSYHKLDPKTKEIVLNSNGAPIWEGFCIDFIETLSEKMNFEYVLVPPTKGKFGKRYKNGYWDGIIGDLVSGETDFAVTALKMYSEREEVIDYIAPYFEQTGISIVIRKPVRQTSLFKFMTVLRVEVWLSIIAALVATAVMLWLMDKYSPYSSRNNKAAYPYPCREFTLRECFWFALTSFTPQGGGEAPKAVSGRILVAAYWLFVVLMLATFTANLAAFLTVERMQTPVQSLEQLARQSRINYTVVHESDTHHYFINMKFAEDTLYRMWKELALNASEDYHKYRIWDYPIKEQYGHILLSINASQPVRDAAEGFRKVNEHENADFAFIHDSSEIKYEITLNCNLTEVGEVFAEQPYAIAVQQGSHLSDELSYATLELQKDRYFEELKAKYWNYSRLNNCPLSENQEGITLESLGGVFIATLFGLALAMLTLALEVFYYKRKAAATQKIVGITQVNPLQAQPAWLSSDQKMSSPTNATFRGKKIPEGITLGDGNFKPRRLDITAKMEKFNTNFLKDQTLPSSDSELPPYVE